MQIRSVARDNQTFIGLRLDPELLDAVDKKRKTQRLSRSQFIRDAIFEAVADLGVSKELVTPQDRVGEKKGGRPKKSIDETEPILVAAEDALHYGKQKKA